MEENRISVSVTLPPTAVAWLNKKVQSRVYASRSHALEVLVLEASMKRESASGGSAVSTAGFRLEKEFTINGPNTAAEVDTSADLEHQFVKAMDEAWNFGSRNRVIKVFVEGQKEPRLFYRLKNLGTVCDANSTRQEYLAVNESLQIVRLVVTATRDPTGMCAAMEAEQTALTPEQAKQLGFTHDQMVAEVQRFLRGVTY